MSGKLSVFRSAAAQAEFSKAYEAALGLWPVPYEELAVPTRYGETHVVACGDRRAAPLVLLQPAGCGAAIWYRNAAALARDFRTYAVDTIGEVNKSIPTRRVESRAGLADWMAKVFAKAKRLIRHLEFAVVQSANHNAQYTAAEEVNRRVLQFLPGSQTW
jgi:pimeloyl-ACP methyl ester carboxylesterase